MKKRILLLASFVLLFVVLFLNGCIKDTVKRSYTYTIVTPIYETKASVRSKIKSGPQVAIQQPGKLVVVGKYIFLNEVDKGIHVIDNSDPAHPKNSAFINIPGNQDLAIKGNTLYADLYTNLIALNISDPTNTSLTKVIETTFPSRFNSEYYDFDSTQMIVGWNKKDTTVSEKYDMAAWKRRGLGGIIVFGPCPNCDFGVANPFTLAASASTIAKAGSTARFTIVGDRLYTVGNHEGLGIFNISDPTMPTLVGQPYIGLAIETIFPLKDRLFIGAANGMYIYDVTNPDQPTELSLFTHAESCDPVIADGNNAYVTLRTGTVCSGTINQMEVLDISNLTQPSLVKTYDLTHPMGLAKDGNLLFVCDDTAGLKVYDASKPNEPTLLKTINSLQPHDVIAYNGLAIVVAKDALYQFDYTNANNIRLLSKMSL